MTKHVQGKDINYINCTLNEEKKNKNRKEKHYIIFIKIIDIKL